MGKIRNGLSNALAFLDRQPALEGSNLLKKESTSLANALEKYNAKTEEVELSLSPNFTEVAALVEGEAKSRVTTSFIKDFTNRHCSTKLVFQKSGKPARIALLLLAAREGRLDQLRQALDRSEKYREMYHHLMETKEDNIRAKILGMPATDFKGIVTAIGLDAPRIQSGVSSSATARKQVLKQMLRDKKTDELMNGLGPDV